MPSFYRYEVENLYSLYSVETDELEIPSEQLETANSYLVKNVGFYLR